MVTTRIDIPGTFNLRDFAGFTVDGGAIRERSLYRADALHKLRPEDGRRLEELGISTVIDLRDDTERASFPNRVPDSISLIAQPIFPDAASHVQKRMSIYELTDLIYFDHAVELGKALTQIAHHDERGVLFHCTAGKDRTGAVAALTLLALGASRESVLEDYSASEEHLSGQWIENYLAALNERGFHPDNTTVGLIVSTPSDALERALNKMNTHYGSVHGYLREAALVNDDTLAALRNRLVQEN